MQEFALTIDLVDDEQSIAEYVRYHAAVWPEVIADLRGVGITDMRIWLLGRRMFMLMRASDEFEPDRDFARLEATSPRYNEWQRLMDRFQSRVSEAGRDEHWAAMTKVFDLSDYPFPTPTVGSDS